MTFDKTRAHSRCFNKTFLKKISFLISLCVCLFIIIVNDYKIRKNMLVKNIIFVTKTSKLTITLIVIFIMHSNSVF